MLYSVLGPTGLLATGMPTITGLLDGSPAVPTEQTNWSIGNFLQNSITTLQEWGKWLIILIGVILIVWACVQIARGLISHGKTQISWPVNIIMLIMGGVFMIGGFSFMAGVASGGKQTLTELGGSTGTGVIMLDNLLSILGL
ncbi:MAG: hypothetical protein HDQ88_08970 [Clostridia bacterium]|nr:hypothetical protein [Clostridia bacterium]